MTPSGEDGESRRGRPSGGFRIAERKRGASDIERRTAWLAWPLFSWTGECVCVNWPREVTYRPASEIIADALSKRAAGLYAVRLEYSAGLNPTVVGVAEVGPGLVATTLEAIQAARRYPRELPRRVGDLEAWRSLAEQRLHEASRIVEARTPLPLETAASLPAACRGEGVESAVEEYVRAYGKTAADLQPLLTALVQEFEQLEAGVFHTPRGALRFGVWRASLAGLIGRACAFCSPELVVRQTIGWLAACRQAVRGRTAEDVYAMLATSLCAWFEEARWQRPDLERMLEALPGLVGRIPSGLDLYDWFRAWHSFVLEYRAVGSLGALDSSQVQRLLRYDLLGTATQRAERQPRRLKWLVAVEDEWLELSARMNRRAAWGHLFAIGNERLVRRLLGRLYASGSAGAASAERAFSLFDDVITLIAVHYWPRTMKESESILQRNFWLYDELARRHSSEPAFRDRAGQVLELVGVRACMANESSVRSMARRFLDEPFDYDLSRAQLELCSQLAESDHEKFLRILKASPLPDDHCPADAVDGWAHLHRHPAVRTFLIECAGHTEMVPRIWRLLFRLALALRLQLAADVGAALRAWTHPPAATPPDLPPLPAAVASQLTTLAAYQDLAGESEPLPASIREILRWPERRREELETLRLMRDAGHLPGAAQSRFDHLEKETSVNRTRAALQRLQKACEKEIAPAKLRALEVAIGNVINLHWRGVGLPHVEDLAAPEWDNALQIYISLRKNRPSLRNLLREEASGSREWIHRHPANVAFVETMRASGLDMDRWLIGSRTSSVVDGAKWELYTETEPLRMLQMGSLFSTCLGAGGVNAFAAVANAIELNKRVLYLKTERGAIVGRRLIGLSRPIEETDGKPMLVAYRSYGSCDASGWSPGVRSSPWVRILFDLHCARLARDVGAEVSSEPTVLQAASNTLRLFLKWYDDGPEPLDWWVISPSTGPLAMEGRRDQLAHLLHPWLERGLREIREGSLPMGPLIRVLLWLEDGAVPLLQRLGPTSLPLAEMRFLERWSQAPAVRELLAEWIRNAAAS